MGKPLQPYTHKLRVDDEVFQQFKRDEKRYLVVDKAVATPYRKGDLVEFLGPPIHNPTRYGPRNQWYRKQIKSISAPSAPSTLSDLLAGISEDKAHVASTGDTYTMISFYKGSSRRIYKYGMVKRN